MCFFFNESEVVMGAFKPLNIYIHRWILGILMQIKFFFCEWENDHWDHSFEFFVVSSIYEWFFSDEIRQHYVVIPLENLATITWCWAQKLLNRIYRTWCSLRLVRLEYLCFLKVLMRKLNCHKLNDGFNISHFSLKPF